jgi:superfamily II DNA or RNA helicase
MLACSPLELLETRLCAISPDRAQGDAWERALCDWINAGGHDDWKRAWLWNDWPERARLGLKGDKGVDLVAETVDGERVAIQAKFRRAPHDPVTAPEVQKLVGSYRKHFAQFALVSNAHRASSGVAEAVSPADAMLVLRETLEASPYDWSEARALPRPGFRPFPFQVQAAEDIRAALADAGRAQIVMACGTGKTVTMLMAMESLDAERVLVLAPTLLLVKQLRDEWVSKRTEGRPWASLAVCSDIGRGEDEADLSPAEIGAPATTDPEHIAAFLRLPGRRVVFGTYASSDRIAKAQEQDDVPAFDLALADEAHRIAGVVAARNAGERSQRVVLDEHRIRATRRLFATATPRVTSGGRSRDGDEVLIESMDDEARFGRVVHSITFQKAVELERLVPYKLVVTVVTEAEVADAIRARAFVDVNGETVPADTLAGAIALRRAFGELGISRIISYHARVDGARAFAELLPRVPGPGDAPTAEHVAGTMPVHLRKAVLKRLAEATGPTVVTNARCLTEGIDVPALDAVAFIDPRRSQVDIVQAVGRAMRRPVGASAKTTGYILLPVYLTAADLADPEAAVEGSAFEPVLRVLRALKDHDPLMARFVAKALVAAGERPLPRGQGIDEVLEVRLGQALDKVLAERLVEAVRLRAVDVAADPFERNLELLRRFVEREGHARVPVAHLEAGVRLGAWVNKVRSRDEVRSPQRRAQLVELGFIWDARAEQLARQIDLLRRFKQANGHTVVPRSYVESDIKLGQWVGALRSKRDELPADLVATLDALEFEWDPFGATFDKNVRLLAAFSEREGHVLVPASHVEDGVGLGAWTAHLRSKASSLSSERVGALNALGFVWDPLESKFARNMALLEDFVQREGHARVPADHLESGIKLGRWVTKIRSRRSRLSAERLAKLEALKFVWEPQEDRFPAWLELLRRFSQREGHACVPRDHVEDGFALGAWVNGLRGKKHELSSSRLAMLDDVRFVWDVAEDRFHDNFRLLSIFIRREGHSRVPSSHVEDGVNLGAWVARLRRTRSLVPPERIALLTGVGFIWQPRHTTFERNLLLLQRFVAREGHARVPSVHTEDGAKLGVWVASIRSRRSTLTDAQIAQLDELGFVWNGIDERFGRKLSLLADYIRENGHGRVPYGHVVGDVRLGEWVASLRTRRRDLSADDIAALDALRFTWSINEDTFDRHMLMLTAYVAREGHALVPAKWIEGELRLGGWVSSLRAKRASLTPERIAQLDALGFVWSVRGKKSARAPNDAPHESHPPDATDSPEVRAGRDEPHDG